MIQIKNRSFWEPLDYFGALMVRGSGEGNITQRRKKDNLLKVFFFLGKMADRLERNCTQLFCKQREYS